tara:strand:+ start:767 stop:4297 length:3531 start_codon:yes stop_codon:yes gene_type:complete
MASLLNEKLQTTYLGPLLDSAKPSAVEPPVVEPAVMEEPVPEETQVPGPALTEEPAPEEAHERVAPYRIPAMDIDAANLMAAENDPDRAWFYKAFGGEREYVHSTSPTFRADMTEQGLNAADIPNDPNAYYRGPPSSETTEGQEAGPPVTDASLLEDNTWIYAASVAYKMFNGEDHPQLGAAMGGDRKAREVLSEYGKVWAAGFNWNLGDMAWSVGHLADSEKLEAQAAVYLLDMYTQKGTTRDDWHRSVREVFTDPVNIALLFTSFGLGNIIARGATYGFKQGAMQYAKRSVPHALVGGAITGPFAGLHNAAHQYTQIRAGVREGVDPTEVALHTAGGAVVGGVFQGLAGPALEGVLGPLIARAQKKLNQGQWDSAVNDLETAARLRETAGRAAPETAGRAAPEPEQLPPPEARQLPPPEEGQLSLLDPEQPRLTAEAAPGQPVAKLPEEANDLDALGFYSQALRVAEALPQESGTSEQMRKQLLNTVGVRPQELVWTGLNDLFSRKKAAGEAITRDEIVDHLKNNRITIGEVEGVKPGSGNLDEFDPDTLPNSWHEETIMDDDYIDSMAEDYLENIPDYFPDLSGIVPERTVRGAILLELGIEPGSDKALHVPSASLRGVYDRPGLASDVPSTEEGFDELVGNLIEEGIIEVDEEGIIPRTGPQREPRWDNVLDSLNDDGEFQDAAVEMASEAYQENPFVRFTDRSGHGYEIVGNDDIGFTARDPNGNLIDTEEYNFAVLQDGVLNHAVENGHATYIEGATPLYEEYTMDGGTNYREILLTFEPEGAAHRRGHFIGGRFDVARGLTPEGHEMGQGMEIKPEGVENVLAHVRVKDRRAVAGGRGNYLTIEEIQTDWHKGRRNPESGRYELPAYRKPVDEEEAQLQDLSGRMLDMLNIERGATRRSLRTLTPGGSGAADTLATSTPNARQAVETSALFQGLVRDMNLSPDPPPQFGPETFEGSEARLRAELADTHRSAYEDLLNDLALAGGGGDTYRERLTDMRLSRYAGLDRPVDWSPETAVLLATYRNLFRQRADLQKQINRIKDGRPDAPYKPMDERGWPQLAMRRIMRYAAENGYDGVAWSPGSVQRERYKAPAELYDRTIPKIVRKIIKQFDPSGGIEEVNFGDDLVLPSVAITSRMRSSIRRLGQAIMTLPPIVAAGAAMEEGQQVEQPQ